MTLDDAREREVLAVSFIMSRWYWRSCCLASDPRPGRSCEVTERELRVEGEARLEPLVKFAGWYLGSPVNLRL